MKILKAIFDYVKNHWKLVLTITLILFALLMGKCTTDNYKKNQKLLFETELINAKETLRDSIESAKNAQMAIKLDSIQKAEQKKADAANKRADKYKTDADKYKKKGDQLQAKVDDLLDLYGDSLDSNCKKVVNAYQAQVDNLEDLRDAQNEEINELNLVIDADSTGWDACKKESILLTNTIQSKESLLKTRQVLIDDLRKQLSKQNGFFKKNKGWIGFGLGAGLTVLLLK